VGGDKIGTTHNIRACPRLLMPRPIGFVGPGPADFEVRVGGGHHNRPGRPFRATVGVVVQNRKNGAADAGRFAFFPPNSSSDPKFSVGVGWAETREKKSEAKHVFGKKANPRCL